VFAPAGDPLASGLIASLARPGGNITGLSNQTADIASKRVLSWPLAVRAQQTDRIRRIGVLNPFAENDPEVQANITAFRQVLQKLGWTDGRNVRIDYRWGGADPGRIRAQAKELVGLNPDVILVSSALALQPLLQETRSVPIVFTQIADPVGAGLVASLARPGSNITGFTVAEFSSAWKAGAYPQPDSNQHSGGWRIALGF
jgi:ABC-type uncharacterized transport system substrate-binding protein